MTYIKQARKLRPLIEQAAAASLDDQTASEGAALFPRLKGDGSLVSAGTRINWGGVIKRAAVDLWDTAENAPDAEPTLWEDIAYRQGWRIIPATITAGAAFARGERGWMGGGTMSTTQAGQPLKHGVTFIFGNSYESDFIISPNIYSFLNNFNNVS